jgi:hypothetical protein
VNQILKYIKRYKHFTSAMERTFFHPGPRIHPYPFIAKGSNCHQTRKGTQKKARLILGPIPPPAPGPGSGDRLRPYVVGGWRPCGAGAPPTAWRRSRSRSSASCRRYLSCPVPSPRAVGFPLPVRFVKVAPFAVSISSLAWLGC